MSLAASPVAAEAKTRALVLLATGDDLPADLVVQVEGEEEVAARLHELRQAWTVLHDLPLSDAPDHQVLRVPHLVIGPPGVFALFPRHVHLGADGPPHDAAALSRASALVARRLSAAVGGQAVPVNPLCVLVCTSWPTPRSDAFVSVVDVDDLVALLLEAPPLHNEEVVSLLAHAAAEESTWAVIQPQVRACWPSIEADYDATLRVLRRQDELAVPDLVGAGGTAPGSPASAQPQQVQAAYWTGCRRRRPLRPVGPGAEIDRTLDEPEPVEAAAAALLTLVLGLLSPLGALTALAAVTLGLATIRRAQRRSTILSAAAGALLGLVTLAAALPAAIFALVYLEGRWW